MTKDSVKETLRKVFKPTPEEDIERMGSLLNRIFYIGNPRDNILSKIVNNKNMTPQDKLNMACDCVGKYYNSVQIVVVDRYVRDNYYKPHAAARLGDPDIPREYPYFDVATHEKLCSREKIKDTRATNILFKETVSNILSQADMLEEDLMNSLDKDVKAIVEEAQSFDEQNPEVSKLEEMLENRWVKSQTHRASAHFAKNNQTESATAKTETKSTLNSEEQPPEF